jgi:pilus assembly protein Flp/PilA
MCSRPFRGSFGSGRALRQEELSYIALQSGRRKGVNNHMMSRFCETVFRLFSRLGDEEGQTMAEYGLLLAVIAVVVVAAALILGQSISSLFLGVTGSL